MLISLHVKNLALIQETEVYFGPGLNILTGETGAGKSIIIGSVNLALGAKADKDMIRTGEEYALIELVFQVEKEDQIRKLRELGLPLEEDGEVILSRRIMATRSISRINGETVNTKLLRKLAGILIDIHGQHDSQQLLQSRKHLEILDHYASEELSGIKDRLKEQYHNYTQLLNRLDATVMDEQTRAREIAMAEFEVKEICEARLRPGEDEELERVYRRMSNSRRIAEALSAVYAMTGYDQEGAAGEITGRALRELHSVTAFDDGLEGLAGTLADIDGLLNDFNRAVSDYLSGLEFDQADFTAAEERLNTVNRLKDKYGDSIEAILLFGEKRQEELERLLHAEEYGRELKEELRSAEEKLKKLCAKATKARTQNGKKLANALKTAMTDLNFAYVDFTVSIKQKEFYSVEGWDDVEFLISTNPGEPKKPLANVASGGELSRIMLALKSVAADQEDTDTFIFDEIDAGISGRTAWKVSEKLALIGRGHQIICITHLPQIAAMADSHFVIEKKTMEDSTSTSISQIKDEEMLHELARLLGSDKVTEAGIANARELKEMAANTKQY